MAIWRMDQIKAPPQTDDPAQLRQYIKYLSNQIASMLKDLDYVLNGQVDFRNVRAKSIKADNLNVDELSAITANMGKITSGEIYGAYIASREAAYPRAELKSSGDVFAAFHDANNYISIESDYAGVPSLNFTQGGSIKGRMDTAISLLELIGIGGLVLSAAGGNLELTATGSVTLTNFYKLLDESTGVSLGARLDAIEARLDAAGI